MSHWRILLDKVKGFLNIIFPNRIDAVHGDFSIDRESNNMSNEAFEKLIKNGFFIKHADIKNRLKIGASNIYL